MGDLATRRQALWARARSLCHTSKNGLLSLVMGMALASAGATMALAQMGPPAVGTSGTDGVFSGSPWTVCRADTSTA